MSSRERSRLPLNAKVDVRDATRSPGSLLRAFDNSSVIPSLKYSSRESPPTFTSGSTAIELTAAFRTPAPRPKGPPDPPRYTSAPMTSSTASTAVPTTTGRFRAASPRAAGIVSRTCTISDAVWGRSAGLFSRHLLTRLASAGGTLGRRRSIGSGLSLACAASIACAELRVNGGEPVSISYAMTPKA